MTELRRAVPFLVLVLALLAAGCTSIPEATGEPALPADDGSSLEAAAARWAAAGIDDYRLELAFLCACALPATVEVDVVDGVPRRITVDGASVDLDALTQFPTSVDGLFQEGRRVVRDGGTVSGVFDETTGAPSRLDIDSMPDAIDDELQIVVKSLVPTS